MIMFCFGKKQAKDIIKAIKVVRAKKEKEGKEEWL